MVLDSHQVFASLTCSEGNFHSEGSWSPTSGKGKKLFPVQALLAVSQFVQAPGTESAWLQRHGVNVRLWHFKRPLQRESVHLSTTQRSFPVCSSRLSSGLVSQNGSSWEGDPGRGTRLSYPALPYLAKRQRAIGYCWVWGGMHMGMGPFYFQFTPSKTGPGETENSHRQGRVSNPRFRFCLFAAHP